MPNDEKTISPKSNVVAFVNPAEVVRRVEYVFGQLQTLGELGMVQGHAKEVITSLMSVLDSIHKNKPETEVMQAVDNITTILTKFATEFSELSEQVSDQDDQIASLMRQVQEYDSQVPVVDKASAQAIPSEELERALTLRQENIAVLTVKQQNLEDLRAGIEESVEQQHELERLKLADEKTHKQTLKTLEEQKAVIEKKLTFLGGILSRLDSEAQLIENYKSAVETVSSGLPENLLGEFEPAVDEYQEVESEISIDISEPVVINPIEVKQIPFFQGKGHPRRLQLEDLAAQCQISAETVFVLSLYDMFPKQIRCNIRMRGVRSLVERSEKAGLVKSFDCSSADRVINYWRSGVNALTFIENHLQSAGVRGKNNFIHWRKNTVLPWETTQLFSKEEIENFLRVDAQEIARNKQA
jgi:hypothetical protein